MNLVQTIGGIQHRWLIKQRASDILRRHRQHKEPYMVNFSELSLQMQPNVFCPAYADGSQLLSAVLAKEIQPNDVVLDIGTGSGVMALIAAQKCQKVVATDISPLAVNCAQKNAALNEVIIDVRLGDLFEHVKPEERFSLIVFNPPFMDGEANDWLETAMYDKDYQTLQKFFRTAKEYLSDNGRIILVFSEAGDTTLLQKFVSQARMKMQIMQECTNELYGLNVLVYKIY